MRTPTHLFARRAAWGNLILGMVVDTVVGLPIESIILLVALSAMLFAASAAYRP